MTRTHMRTVWNSREQKYVLIMSRVSALLLMFFLFFILGMTYCQTIPPRGSLSNLAQAMDLSVAPCDDFFKFSCGGWINKNPIPPNKPRMSQFDIIRDKVTALIKEILERDIIPEDPKPVNDAKIMYRACMDTARIHSKGLKPLTDFLSAHGGWPMVTDNWDPNSFDWRRVTGAIRRQFRISYLINVFNDLDSLDTRRSAIHVDQGSLTLPHSAYTNPKTSARIIEAYNTYITRSAKVMRDYLKTKASDAQIEVDARNLVTFETELAKILSPAENRRNNARMYNPMLVSELQTWTDGFAFKSAQAAIDWQRYFNTIYGPTGIAISSNERVIIVEREYIRKLLSLLEVTPPRIIANFIHWRLIRYLSPSTSSAMNSLALAFAKVLYGNSPSETRANLCANDVNAFLGYAVSAKYVEQHFDERAKAQVLQMIKNTKAVFKDVITTLNWMDDEAKKVAIEKVDAMVELVGYPDWIKDKAALESHYSGLTVAPTEHFANLMNVNALLTRQELRGLRRTPDRTRWPTFPTIVNAMYSPKYNSIVFPAGIIQPPFFGLDGRPAAMNYGSLGAIIGHELIHGFDDRGRQNDKLGNIIPWWSENTISRFVERAECFIRRYEKYEALDGLRLNGVTTQGENIADNGGMRQAYNAFRRFIRENVPQMDLPGLGRLTPNQLFFISYAQTYCETTTDEKLADQVENGVHSPGRFRVIGPLSNSEDFIREFKCPPGSPMNVLDKCALWI